MVDALEEKANNLKPSRKKKGNNLLCLLPLEVLQDIALRLPIKYLLRLRSTCKFWHGLLTHPMFVEQHLSHSIKNPGYLVASCHRHGDNTFRYACHLVDYDRREPHKFEDTVLGEADSPWERTSLRAFPRFSWASSGGLMAYCGHRDHANGGPMAYCGHPDHANDILFLVLNPLIHEPPISVRLAPDWEPKLFSWTWAFAYSPLRKEYKILVFYEIALEWSWNPDYGWFSSCHAPVVCEVHTLASGTWRKIENVPFLPALSDVQCNGSIFMLKESERYATGRREVMAFDVASEQFRSFPGPPVLERPHETRSARLFNFRDTIAYGEYYGGKLAMWALRNHVTGTWVREMEFVTAPATGRVFCGTKEVETVWFWKNEHEQFGYELKGTGLFSYDTKQDMVKSVRQALHPGLNGVIPHVVSLVSVSDIVAEAANPAVACDSKGAIFSHVGAENFSGENQILVDKRGERVYHLVSYCDSNSVLDCYGQVCSCGK